MVSGNEDGYTHTAQISWLRPALSLVLSGLQGGWCDEYGCTYLVRQKMRIQLSNSSLAPKDSHIILSS